MKVTILSTFLVAFSGLAASAPVAEPQDPNGAPRFYPDMIFNIMQGQPDTASIWNPGRVFLFGGGKSINTILSIPLGQGNGGRTCRLSFQGQDTASGTKTVDIYSVNGVSAYGNTMTWNNRPQRGRHWGNFVANSDGDQLATNWGSGNPTFPCPEGPTRLEFELAPSGTGDMYLLWGTGSGLFLTIS